MEQPPGSKDDLQPQDLSTCSTVNDLTRKGEECVLNAHSIEPLHMVNSASWYPNSGKNKNAHSFSDTGPADTSLQPGDQIQPANGFSNTTVTFSYVSRPHAFSPHDSLSQHSPRQGSQSVDMFPLLPSCEEETGYGLSPHYFDQGERPLDMGAHTDLFETTPKARVGPDRTDAGGCVTRHAHRLNGDVAGDGGSECVNVGCGVALENGQDHSWLGTSASPEVSASHAGSHGESVDSEVLFVVSSTQEPVMSARDLCMMSREYISPLDPASPSASSLDEVEDIFILPQTCGSPSADISYPGVVDPAASDGLAREGTVKPSVIAARSSSDAPTLLDTSSESSLLLHRHKTVSAPVIDLTEDEDLPSNPLEEKNKKEAAIPHINGNARTLQGTVMKRQLPPRSGRGTRLEAIVLNINSNRYKVLDCVHTAKQTNTTQTSTSVINLVSSKKKAPSFVGKNKVGIVPIGVKMTLPKRVRTKSINTDLCKESTSNSLINNNSKSSRTITPPKTPSGLSKVNESKKRQTGDPSPQCSPRPVVRRTPRKKPEPSITPPSSTESGPQAATHKAASREPEHHPRPHLSPETVLQMPSPPITPKKSPSKPQGKPSCPAKRKNSPPAKRRRKKKQKVSHVFPPSSLFAPREPEIKLRYVHYKEARRDPRLDAFSPFVRVCHRRSCAPACTVINYPEEKALPRVMSSGAVPATSCLWLGRPRAHSRRHAPLVCCLCGGPANAMDLGDLHGPYYTEGQRPPGGNRSMQGPRENNNDDDDDSSSDSSSFGAGEGSTPPPWPSSPREEVTDWYGAPSGSPAAKRPRAEVKDWYSAPLVPLEPCEYWLHEDCGVWSAGVFLVKGRLYGLEEAVAVARETLCSGCCNPGATLGCFFKGCPNKYHYRCALKSDCMLIEDNFSLKCKKHKNKTFKAPPGNRWLDR